MEVLTWFLMIPIIFGYQKPARSHHDLARDAREHLAALGVFGTFFALNSGPFTVTRHNS